MNTKPVTLGDWYKTMKVDDYNEAARLLAKQTTPPEWLPTFLMHWAPEIKVQRERTTDNVSREYIMDKLAAVESAAVQLAELLEDRAVMKFLQMPPHRPFQSELGTKMFVGEIVVRAHDAATSPIVVRGDGKENSGAGKAVTTDDVSPEQLCATIVGEGLVRTAWHLSDRFQGRCGSGIRLLDGHRRNNGTEFWIEPRKQMASLLSEVTRRAISLAPT